MSLPNCETGESGSPRDPAYNQNSKCTRDLAYNQNSKCTRDLGIHRYKDPSLHQLTVLNGGSWFLVTNIWSISATTTTITTIVLYWSILSSCQALLPQEIGSAMRQIRWHLSWMLKSQKLVFTIVDWKAWPYTTITTTIHILYIYGWFFPGWEKCVFDGPKHTTPSGS